MAQKIEGGRPPSDRSVPVVLHIAERDRLASIGPLGPTVKAIAVDQASRVTRQTLDLPEGLHGFGIVRDLHIVFADRDLVMLDADE